MNLQQRKDLLQRLGTCLTSNDPSWQRAKEKAFLDNQWFIPEFIEKSVESIANEFLQPSQLDELSRRYHIPQNNTSPQKVGIVMAGNIPLVGFHDFLCVFITGHQAWIKPSTKDEALIRHIVSLFHEWEPETKSFIRLEERLKNCDAYIATGSNNTSRYFDYYFGKFPNIIRKNRTSVAILTGEEEKADLEKLADDVYLYFGLGCRNVSKIYVPEGYDFVPLLNAFRKYDYLINHNKYKNNYDYNLAAHILNKKFYMTNGSILLVEDEALFSPISQVHYQYYANREDLRRHLQQNDQVQCIVNDGETGFGDAQHPGICNFADGVDTMDFLMKLTSEKEVRKP
jgi:Acyl-CoA reductase (LuxC).